MTIWACQAGKDVYVEKPCSHNIHEGRIAVETARKHKRIVQHGTQSRSEPAVGRPPALAKSGKLGKLLVSRGLCYKDGGTGGSTRGDIGTKPTQDAAVRTRLQHLARAGAGASRTTRTSSTTAGTGSGTSATAMSATRASTRWTRPAGSSPVRSWPKSVISFGGRYANNDQGQTPNALVTIFDYGETQLIFETRGLKSPAVPRRSRSATSSTSRRASIAGNKFYPKGKGDGEPIPKADGRSEDAAATTSPTSSTASALATRPSSTPTSRSGHVSGGSVPPRQHQLPPRQADQLRPEARQALRATSSEPKR